MSETLTTITGTKEEQYKALIPQIRGLLSGETDPIANMANTAAALQQQFHFWWTGFYLVKEETLVLGPFQGPIACTRIAKGKGVCGTAWAGKKSLIVKEVSLFPGHIACSSVTRSEIVVPLLYHSEVWAVLDIDSEKPANFDATDQLFLQQIAGLVNAASRF